jgi:hypothetical protein
MLLAISLSNTVLQTLIFYFYKLDIQENQDKY